MLSELLKKDSYGSDFTKATLANILNSGSVFLLTLVLIRLFPQTDFARIGTGLAAAFILAKVMDAGLSFTALRFGAKYNQDAKGKKYIAVLYLALLLETVMFLVLAILFGNSFFSTLFFGRPDAMLLLVTVLTAAGMALHAAVRADFQANQDYNGLFYYHLGLSAIRLVLIGMFYFHLLPLSPLVGLLAIYFLPVLITGLFLVKHIYRYCQNLKSWATIRTIGREMLTYAPWVWLSSIFFILVLRGPVIILNHFNRLTDVAIFTAVLSFVSIISLLNDAARSVIIPRTVAFASKEDYAAFLDKYSKVIPKITLLMLLATILSGAFVQLFLPAGYLPDSLIVYYILAVSMLLTSLVGPITSLIHSIGKPVYEFWVNLVRAGSIMCGCFLLIYATSAGLVYIALFCGIIIVLGEYWFSRFVRQLVVSHS